MKEKKRNWKKLKKKKACGVKKQKEKKGRKFEKVKKEKDCDFKQEKRKERKKIWEGRERERLWL